MCDAQRTQYSTYDTYVTDEMRACATNMIRMTNMRDEENMRDDTRDAVHNDARRIDNENGDVTVAGSTIKPEQTDGIDDAVKVDEVSGTQSPMRRLVAQLMKFGVVGIIAFVIDYGVMVALTELLGLNPVLSATISFTVSVVFNYVASMRYVFTHRNGMSRRREFFIFVVLSVIGLGLNDLLMWLGTDTIGIDYRIVKIGATAIVMVYNFVTRRVLLDGGEK